MMNLMWVAAGGALGALARYGVWLAFSSGRSVGFPWATLCVNVLGCAAIGVMLGHVGDPREWLSDQRRLFVVTGFLGAFTTFSTFGYETFELIEHGRVGWAASYVAVSLVASALALVAGVWGARVWG